MKNLFRARSLPIFFLAFITVGLSLALFWESWTVNRWSIAYLSHSLSAEDGGAKVAKAPERHQRAPVWMARDALRAGEPVLALDLLKPIIPSGKVMALSVQADALAASGDFEGAVSTWIQAGDYLSLLNAAQENKASGLSENAERAYKGAWQVNQLQGTGPLMYFYWHFKSDPAEAERILRQSIALVHPTPISWMRALGLVLEAQDRWDEALAVYMDALDRNNDDVNTLRLMGLAYYHGKDDFDAALGIFKKMIQIEPEKGEGYFAIGQLMAQEGRYDESEQWFMQALQRDPDRPDIWAVRVTTAGQSHKFSLALDIFDQAIQQFPDYASLYYAISWVYKLDSKPEQAIQSIEQALALQQPPSVWYFVRAGAIYEWAGDQGMAIKAYERALAIVPSNHQAQDALSRLHANGN